MQSVLGAVAMPARIGAAALGVGAICAGLSLLTAAGTANVAQPGLLVMTVLLYGSGLTLVLRAIRSAS